MAQFYKFPGGEEGGGPPSDPTIELRLSRLEEEQKRQSGDLQKLLVELAEVKGMLSRVPSTQQLWAMTVASWIAGAGIVVIAARLLVSG